MHETDVRPRGAGVGGAIDPSPYMTELRSFASPVPTHTTQGSDGATAMSPIAATCPCSKIDA
ncbi:MAG: hypothetical protein M3081_17315, partial [Gemmatimonadota bacterium]|nr:hypothetical protein [Gemmatimonadota bacterium]